MRMTGNPVTILYRRTRKEMPAAEEELEGALEEGNVLEELVAPVRIIRNGGKVVAIECVRNRLGEPGPDGRREPLAIPGSEFTIETDSVIAAVGQLPELAFLEGSGVTRHRGGGVLVNPATGCAGPAHIYAGGDVVIKPDSIIAACADGRRAAEAICAEFCIPFEQPAARPAILTEDDILAVKQVRTRKEAQQRPAVVPPAQRINFLEFESTLDDAVARAEGLRCVQCTSFCDKCVEVCPNRANLTFATGPVRYELPRLACQDGALSVVGSDLFHIAQGRQILHVDDWCNECDNCQTFCVHQGKPYVEKPRLFLKEADFLLEADNAFFIDGSTVRRRQGGAESRLTREADCLRYENDWLQLALTPDFEVTAMALKQPFTTAVSVRDAAEMAVVLDGVLNSLPHLLA